MKKMKSILKRQSKIIIPFVIGLVVATTVSYGVNQIQSSSVSYTKSDGTTVSVKQALDDVINKSLSEINTLKEKAEIYKYAYLVDVAQVGDYVAYDAGSWTETKAEPTSQSYFSGYTKGQNKANSVACNGSTTLKGWRVLSIDTSTKTVTLIHAGQPECYFHMNTATASGQSEASVTNLNNRATSTYLNSDYADSAHMMNYSEALAITGNDTATDNNLRTTGGWYWLATASNTDNLFGVSGSGSGGSGSGSIYSSLGTEYGGKFGVRPVIVLKSKILTTGIGTDMVGQEAWTLVKP